MLRLCWKVETGFDSTTNYVTFFTTSVWPDRDIQNFIYVCNFAWTTCKIKGKVPFFFCFPNFVFIMRLICQINGFLTLFIRRTILNSFEYYFSFWPICTFVACSLYSFTPKPLIYDGCDFTFFRIDSDQIVQIDLNSCFCLTSGAMEDKNKIFLLNDINP